MARSRTVSSHGVRTASFEPSEDFLDWFSVHPDRISADTYEPCQRSARLLSLYHSGVAFSYALYYMVQAQHCLFLHRPPCHKPVVSSLRLLYEHVSNSFPPALGKEIAISVLEASGSWQEMLRRNESIGGRIGDAEEVVSRELQTNFHEVTDFSSWKRRLVYMELLEVRRHLIWLPQRIEKTVDRQGWHVWQLGVIVGQLVCPPHVTFSTIDREAVKDGSLDASYLRIRAMLKEARDKHANELALLDSLDGMPPVKAAKEQRLPPPCRSRYRAVVRNICPPGEVQPLENWIKAYSILTRTLCLSAGSLVRPAKGLPRPPAARVRLYKKIEKLISKELAPLPEPLETGSESRKANPATGNRNSREKASKEARDRFIYKECCRGTQLKIIRVKANKHENWGYLKTIQGVKAAALSYAKRNNLDPPQLRQQK